MKNHIPYLIFFFTLMVFLCIFFNGDKDNQNNLPKNTNRIDSLESDNMNEIEKESYLRTSGSWNLTGDPIWIFDDFGWAFTEANYDWCNLVDGVYVIENVTIDGLNTDTCIEILNSEVPFLIKNCTVYNSGTLNGGIWINNAKNGRLENNTIYNCYYGIILISSDTKNNTIIDNTLYSNQNGIYLTYANNNTISNNTAYGNDNGIMVARSRDVIIFNNTANNNERGIRLWEDCINIKILNNTSKYNYISGSYSGIGMLMNDNCTNILISGNTFNENDYTGIYGMDECNFINISDNKLDNNVNAGVRFEDNCHDNFIMYNNLTYNYIGVVFEQYVDNNTIRENYISHNNRKGLWFEDYCDGNKIIKNNITENVEDGIYSIGNCDEFEILGNNISNNKEKGIYFGTGQNSVISNNTINDNIFLGIHFYWCQWNTILNNSIKFNGDDGIYIYLSDNNTIQKNKIWNNTQDGLALGSDSNFNNITNNELKGNEQYGLNIGSDCFYNLIWNNNFSNNIIGNAIDNGNINFWNNSVIGNYWDDYNGFDCNGDNIGETPYDISGSALSKDYLPIWSIFDNVDPVITINSPSQNDFLGIIAPNFDISIDEYLLNTSWYMLYNSTYNSANITFIYLVETSISQSVWDDFGNGTLTIRFYANDTVGNLQYKEVTVRKDNIAPEIIINDPQSVDFVGLNAPDFDITINELNLNDTWYVLYNSTYTSNNIFFTYLIDTTILQSEWEKLGNGTVTIRFYANDSAGNFQYEEVSVRKDIIAPEIIINDPQSVDFFRKEAPDFDILINEAHLNTTWYMLYNSSYNSANITFSYLVDISILQSVWDDFGNGTITIRFYANDTAGNLAYQEITVRKDIIAPDIVINDPKPLELFGKDAPDFDIIINEANLNTTWYMLYNSSYTAANTTFTYLVDISILQSVWDDFGNSTITIRFYANDTIGNLAYQEITVRKDIITPDIVINDPKPLELFGKEAPDFDIIINEVNLNTTWYMLYNSSYNSANITFTYLVDISILQSVWDDFGNGTITIRFYANDTAGNLAYQEITVRKDIIAPDIIINDPKPLELFGKDAPDFDIIINEANLNTTWYYLTDGIFQTVNVSFIYLIDITILQSVWNQVNGEFITIYFYANDSMGNINFQSITIKKLADYWVLSPFVIDDDKSNGAGDYNWTEATVFDWCSGSGTIGNPYFIGNLYINGSGLGSCLTIRDTSKFFIVNNSIIFNSGNGDFDAGIKLINVNNGTISYNNCSLNQNGIILRNSNNNNLSRNTINNNNLHGIAVFNSSYNKILYNNETIDYNNFCGLFLNNSHFNNITGNYICYNNIGICLNSSNYNTITYNLFIGNNQDIVQNNCIKNFIGPNYHEPVLNVDDGDDNGNGKDDPEEISDIVEILIAIVGFIIIVSIIGIILVIVLVKSRGSGKKRKKETEKILDILHEIR